MRRIVMDHITDAMEMVDLLQHPAFCVQEGIIVKVNTAARQRLMNRILWLQA